MRRQDYRREQDARRSDRSGTHDIKQLWERSHEMLRLAFLGWNHKDIADKLGVTPVTVNNTVNSTLGQRKLAMLDDARDADSIDVAEKVAELAPKAVEIYKEILEEEEASLSLKKKTADTILKDILGHQAPKKVEGRFAHAHLGEEDINRIKERSRAAAAVAGVMIEE